MLAGFEGEEGDAPGEGGDKVGIGADDVEGAADGAAGVEVCEDGGCVVGRLFVVKDGAGGFEKLGGGSVGCKWGRGERTYVACDLLG